MTVAELRDHARFEQQLLRLADITKCPADVDIYVWLLDRALVVSFDGVNYVLTQRAIDLVLIDEIKNPYR